MPLYNFVKSHNITKTLFISYFIGFSVIIYFLFYAIFSSNGLIKYLELANKIKNKEVIEQGLLSKINEQEHQIKGMNINSLDLDLLDEQAKKNLGYIKKNEVVLYQEENNKNNQTYINPLP